MGPLIDGLISWFTREIPLTYPRCTGNFLTCLLRCLNIGSFARMK